MREENRLYPLRYRTDDQLRAPAPTVQASRTHKTGRHLRFVETGPPGSAAYAFSVSSIRALALSNESRVMAAEAGPSW